MASTKALLIIDMQKGSFTDLTPRFDTEGVIKRINSLSDIFRKNGQHVIFIQHDGSNGNEFIPGTEPWEILDELAIFDTDKIISKTANDAFYLSDLEIYLNKNKIEELFITGCATDFCVESTIQSALVKNYKITIVADGHTTGDRPHLNAGKIIEHYNWVWKNMIPTGGAISVLSLNEILS